MNLFTRGLTTYGNQLKVLRQFHLRFTKNVGGGGEKEKKKKKPRNYLLSENVQEREDKNDYSEDDKKNSSVANNVKEKEEYTGQNPQMKTNWSQKLKKKKEKKFDTRLQSHYTEPHPEKNEWPDTRNLKGNKRTIKGKVTHKSEKDYQYNSPTTRSTVVRDKK